MLYYATLVCPFFFKIVQIMQHMSKVQAIDNTHEVFLPILICLLRLQGDRASSHSSRMVDT